VSAPGLIDRKEAARLALWRGDPIRFVQDNFGLGRAADYRDPAPGQPPSLECMDWFQEEFLGSLLTHDRICQLAAKGPGKTAGESWGIWWFMACFALGKGAAVSFTGEQLQANLWTEVRKWQQRSPYLMDRFDWTASKIAHKKYPEEWKFEARSWPKTASPDEQAASLSGLHADAVMVVMDESGEIPVGILRTAEAVLANKVHSHQRAWVIQAGNPSKLGHSLHFASMRPETWKVQHITGDPDDPKRARRISKAWAAELIREHGRDHPIVRINVLGLFPHENSDTLIPRSRVQEAMRRELSADAWVHAPKIMGVDPARSGEDRTVIVIRQGRVGHDNVVILTGKDGEQVAGRVGRILIDEKIDKCFVDEIGVGYSVIDHLKHFGNVVEGINSSVRDGVSKGYFNKRAEMWGRMRDWIVKDQCRLPELDGLEDELCTPKYEYRSTDNLLILEDKAEVRLRLGRSPDIADAWAFTFAGPVPFDQIVADRVRRASGRPAHNRAITARDDMSWRGQGGQR
jgi:phage terminase large subunit